MAERRTLAELRQQARELDIAGRSKLRTRDQLLAAIRAAEAATPAPTAASSSLEALPDEILTQVLLEAPIAEMRAACSTSRRIAALCRARGYALWRERLYRDFPSKRRHATPKQLGAAMNWSTSNWHEAYENVAVDDAVLSAIIGVTIRNCFVHPVTFQMVFRPLNLERLREEFDNHPDMEEYEGDAGDLLRRLSWDMIVFGSKITTLTVFSNQTGNDDERGGGAGVLGLPVEDFRYTLRNPNGITLRNVTEGAYRMKGSKYDWGYEMFGDVTTQRLPSAVRMEVSFDYGS